MDRLHLIAEIHKRPALWDIQSEEHKSRICVPDMWKDVAATMGPDATVEECKRKWKNLRDAYRAEIKRIELRIERDLLKGSYDSKNDYNSKWAYFEHMKFIKDIKRPRRSKPFENINLSSNDNLADDNELEFSDFHNMDNIKLEPGVDMNADSYSLDDASNEGEQLLQEAEQIQQVQMEDDTPSQPKLRVNFSLQNSNQNQVNADNKPTFSNCKCPKRSYDQVHFLEDLEKEEQNLMKSTRLDIKRSNDLAHVGDSDYNFLVSFLPQMKKMSELQNLQFRAKTTDLMLTIMSQSIGNNSTSVSSSQNIN